MSSPSPDRTKTAINKVNQQLEANEDSIQHQLDRQASLLEDLARCEKKIAMLKRKRGQLHDWKADLEEARWLIGRGDFEEGERVLVEFWQKK